MPEENDIRCGTCQYFKPVRDARDERDGICRRLPPQITRYGNTYWPEVYKSELCGEYSPLLTSDEARDESSTLEPSALADNHTLKAALQQSAREPRRYNFLGPLIMIIAIGIIVEYLTGKL
jgi:hypothetical protein